MQLNGLDWVIVAASLVVGYAPALFFARRAGRGAAEFFASGRAAPWWLIGTSMVATTFSTDTPNLVTNMVRTKGVADNWEWWAFLLTGMTTVFFYARLWRRSGVLTDLEFYELRYSGPSAKFLRGFRAIYLGLFFNCVIMASVTLAAAKIANVMLGWDRLTTVLVCGAICMVFAVTSGLWGVLTTDMVQFGIAMVGVIGAAYYSLQHPAVGGLAGLLEKIDPATLSVLPDFTNNWELALAAMIIPLTIQWWSVWYPGAEPGGGSYIAQRMLAARDERHALAGTLWFNVAHYALRPWPWIIVALCSMLVYPTLDDIRTALPRLDVSLLGHDMAYPAMLILLPHGLLGLLVAALLAAYVSTMTTHMNWGTSYLVVDFYRRFLNRAASEHRVVALGRIISAVLMVLAGALMFLLTTAKEAFDLMLSIGAGTGLIYLLRWFWWRINAWSEISAMAASFVAAAGQIAARKLGYELSGVSGLIGSVAFTTVVWVIVTFCTPPTERGTLLAFYRRVRPAGPGWNSIRAEAGVAASPDSLALGLLGAGLGCVLVYSALFGVGSVLYGNWGAAVVCAALLAASLLGMGRVLPAVLRRTTVEAVAVRR
jgi:Na+/proline symporter